ncbi:MAG: hypothetical protein Q7R52_04780 [archaeon]|nr:hypothetical protein [archaeon]
MEPKKNEMGDSYGTFLISARRELIRLCNGNYKEIDQRLFSGSTTMYFARISKNNPSENELKDHGERFAREFFENNTPAGLVHRTERALHEW